MRELDIGSGMPVGRLEMIRLLFKSSRGSEQVKYFLQDITIE